jgi:hypothetical protein
MRIILNFPRAQVRVISCLKKVSEQRKASGGLSKSQHSNVNRPLWPRWYFHSTLSARVVTGGEMKNLSLLLPTDDHSGWKNPQLETTFATMRKLIRALSTSRSNVPSVYRVGIV